MKFILILSLTTFLVTGGVSNPSASSPTSNTFTLTATEEPIINFYSKETKSIDYLMHFVDKEFDGSGFNWFTIIFDDGTKIQFSDSIIAMGTYGKLDAKGCIPESKRELILRNSK